MLLTAGGNSVNDYAFIKGMNAYREKDWATFETVSCSDVETAAMLLSCCKNVAPKEVLCKIALYHYIHHGDYFPIIRKYVRMALPYRSKDWRDNLPESVRELKTFVVYRAGNEPIEKAKYSISWTLLPDVAEWFAARHEHYHPDEKRHLYRATISADKVIAYINERYEFEIVQYRNVKNIEEIPSTGVSQEFMNIHEQERNSSRVYEPHCDPKELYFNQWYRSKSDK